MTNTINTNIAAADFNNNSLVKATIEARDKIFNDYRTYCYGDTACAVHEVEKIKWVEKVKEVEKVKLVDLNVEYINTQPDGTTVVRWNDGTVTYVRKSKNDSNDLYTAFCAALAKKIFGSTSNVYKTVNNSYVPNRNAKAAAEKAAKAEAKRAEDKANHDRRIRRMAKNIKDAHEAQMLLMELNE